MSRLDEHLRHIRTEVVPARRSAPDRLPAEYAAEVAARPQPPLLLRGLEQWNAGHFYEQHETLEWLWRALDEPVRDAVKGLILAGVGAYHALRHNRRGALAKWTAALAYLEPFEAVRPYGVDVAHLRAQIAPLLESLQQDERPDWEAYAARVRALRVSFERRPAAPRVTDLLRRLDRAWDEGPHALWPLLERLKAAEAEWTPAPAVPPLRTRLTALGQHKVEVAERFLGRPPFRAPPPAAWPHFLRWLEETHEWLREGVGFLNDADLDRPAGKEEEAPLGVILEACVEGDLACVGVVTMWQLWYRHAASRL